MAFKIEMGKEMKIKRQLSEEDELKHVENHGEDGTRMWNRNPSFQDVSSKRFAAKASRGGINDAQGSSSPVLGVWSQIRFGACK